MMFYEIDDPLQIIKILIFDQPQFAIISNSKQENRLIIVRLI